MYVRIYVLTGESAQCASGSEGHTLPHMYVPSCRRSPHTGPLGEGLF